MADLIHISAEQRDALGKLASVLPSDAYLAGGIAVSARLGHRTSLDLDVFMTTSDPASSIDALAAIEDARIVTRAPGTVHVEVDEVPGSLLRYPYPLLCPVERVPGLALPAASVVDLTAMKLSAIAGRGTAKDFWDLHALLRHRGIGLFGALEEFERKFAAEDLGSVVRSLAYFGDAEASPLPLGLTQQHWMAIKADVRRWVEAL